VPIISSPDEFNVDDLYVDLWSTYQRRLYLKCEGFNFAGSIKLKAATEMLAAAERTGRVLPDSILVESSSGNFGVAMAVLAASRGLRFLCITDPRSNVATRQLIEALGGRVHVVSDVDSSGGFLAARIAYVRELCAADDRYVWLNQYANPDNWIAHYRTTAPAIRRQFPDLDVLFVGAGTTGTVMGCARYFGEMQPRTRVVAVDAVGSVTFAGSPPGLRMIPGLGTGVRPQLVDERYLHDVVHVPEADTVRACHTLAARGFVFGGSTGTVVSGALSWLAEHATPDTTAVAIAPDLGERYLDTLYDPDWLRATYGDVPRASETVAG
jgi:2,3-diaminopropionate biosynthesis protein SbnA